MDARNLIFIDIRKYLISVCVDMFILRMYGLSLPEVIKFNVNFKNPAEPPPRPQELPFRNGLVLGSFLRKKGSKKYPKNVVLQIFSTQTINMALLEIQKFRLFPGFLDFD